MRPKRSNLLHREAARRFWNRRWRGILFTACFVICHFFSCADAATPRTYPSWRSWRTRTNPGAPASASDSKFVIKVWDIDDGLPHSTVTALQQTQDGYLWVGTEHGLARFDGLRFRLFDSDPRSDLATTRIAALFSDSAGRLWIGAEEIGRAHV